MRKPPLALLAVVLLAASAGALGSGAGAAESAGAPLLQVNGIATIGDGDPAESAVIYLVPAPPDGSRAVAEPLAAPPARSSDGDPYHMDQRGLHFEPHVLVVPVGAVVAFTNSDRVLHNIFAPAIETTGFDLGTWPQGETRRHTFEEPGTNVLLCAVHPDMEAFIVVVPTRHFALADSTGSFTIPSVAAGSYRLFVWHERCAPFETIVDIQPGSTALKIDLTLTGH